MGQRRPHHDGLQHIVETRCGTAEGQRQITNPRDGHRLAPLLVGQIGAMGVSLNLQQGGSQIVVVEEDWSPAIMDQFYARLWRFGQKKHVHVDILQDDTKLSKAVARIAGTKARAHERMNEIGREEANNAV